MELDNEELKLVRSLLSQKISTLRGKIAQRHRSWAGRYGGAEVWIPLKERCEKLLEKLSDT